VDLKVRSALEDFNKTLYQELKNKVNEEDFINKLKMKACANDVGKLYLDVSEIKRDVEDIEALSKVLEHRTNLMITGPTPTEEEVQKLYLIKADKAELENLNSEFKRLEGIVNQLDGDYSGDDSYDEYDDEDSQVEDVISLGDGGSAEKEDDEEEFFEGDDDQVKLADKAKEIVEKLKQGSTGLEPMKKLGENEKAKSEIDDVKSPERKKSEDHELLKKNLNKDILESEQHAAIDKKSIPSNTNIDCNETTNSMGMTMGTLNNGNSRAGGIKKQETVKSKKRGLSRMSSKMSISTKKRGGGRGGANSKDVEELKLNMNKVLEDIRKLKNFEHESEVTFRRFENTLVDLKKKNDIFISQHNAITKKQDEIENEHIKGMEISSQRTKKVVKIYNDIQKMINDFKAEYRYGFKKIIKAEVDINVLNQQLKFVKTKIKPKEEEKLNKDDLIKEIDSKFEVLYGQISDMAVDQARFNTFIQKEQDNLKEPLEAEISRIRHESNIMLRELERTQKTNRDMLTHKMTSGMSGGEASPTKINKWLNQSTGFSQNNPK